MIARLGEHFGKGQAAHTALLRAHHGAAAGPGESTPGEAGYGPGFASAEQCAGWCVSPGLRPFIPQARG